MPQFASDWAAYNARWFADSPALEQIEDGRTLTWGQVEARVTRLAGGLAQQYGIRKGDYVSVLAENDISFFELQFACMRLGAIMVPLNWRLAPLELQELCGDFSPSLLVYDETWQEAALRLADGVGIKHRLSWGIAGQEHDFEKVIEAGYSYEARREHLLSDPTHVLYTSGTTGLPKGAVSTFGSLAGGAANMESLTYMTGPGTKQFNPLPLFHAAGLNAFTNPILYGGGAVTISRRFDPDQVLSEIGDPSKGYSHWTAVPIMYEAIARSSLFDKADFSTIRQSHVGNSFDREHILNFADHGLLLQQGYGGTEVGTYATFVPRDKVRTLHGSCGQLLRNMQIRLIAPGGTEDVALGEVGEAWLKGPSVTRGYLNRDPFEDGWYQTGDALRQDEEGNFYVVDRYKDMFKSGGESVFPAEVERVLLQFAAVQEAAVIPTADEKWGNVGLGLIVPTDPASFDVQALNAFCVDRLAKYKIPKYFEVLETLPRNATGKVIKADLARQFAGGPAKLT